MRGLHFFSGLFVSIFILAHLANHLAVWWGEEAHISFMDALRIVYRNVFVEALLLAAVAFQCVSGFILVRRLKGSSLIVRVRRYSSYYLLFFLSLHTSAVVFFGRMHLKLDTNLYFGAEGIVHIPGFFIPYYSLAIVSLFAHYAASMRRRVKIDFNILLLVALVSAVAVSYGIMSGMSRVDVPKAYVDAMS